MTREGEAHEGCKMGGRRTILVLLSGSSKITDAQHGRARQSTAEPVSTVRQPNEKKTGQSMPIRGRIS